MALGKQAKVLSRAQIDGALGYIAKTRHPARNRVIFLLSVKAGLRAKEIASLKWDMLTDADGRIGSAIHLHDAATKGRSGRVIPLNSELRDALAAWWEEGPHSTHVVTTERARNTSAHAIVLMFAKWYRALGLNGCSSHSGRRTFITNAARKISTVGGSLRDVQMLAGHAALSTTQRYIDPDAQAQKKIVELV
jgi:integrase/recombinase XerD